MPGIKDYSSSIPIHRLCEETSVGLVIHRAEREHPDGKAIGVHRDDHYIFAIQEKGNSSMMVDFKQFHSQGSTLIYVMPGQVHHGMITANVVGWFMAIDTMLVEEEYRHVFEVLILQQHTLSLTAAQYKALHACMELLHARYSEPPDTPFYQQVLHTLASSFIGMVAAAYLDKEPGNEQQNNRSLTITREFKTLLRQHCKSMKSPSAYAEALHISLSYLNESVKDITGFTVTYWIQQEIMLEAKRLLYYSELSIKEIACEMGYEDHTYFSRLFTKTTGVSAGQFRKRYRE